MLKLLTKFKTQSLNEVKPYENDGSFVSFCGEVRNINDDGASDHSWPQDHGHDEINGGPKNNQTSLSSTCLISSRLSNELVRTYQLPTEPEGLVECKKKENEDKRSRENRQTGATGLSAAEKRKWSEVKKSRSSSFQQGNDSSSSDEEVKELFSKQQQSGNLKENRQHKAARSGKVRPFDRKRHRRLTSDENRVYSRPSLDFEKMQQKMFWKKGSFTASHARIVKVQSFSGHPPNFLPHPSVMSFKPIQVMQAFKLTPVEESRALAF